jgi:hypothetical protein
VAKRKSRTDGRCCVFPGSSASAALSGLDFRRFVADGDALRIVGDHLDYQAVSLAGLLSIIAPDALRIDGSSAFDLLNRCYEKGRDLIGDGLHQNSFNPNLE